jgi:hypothetical protein
VGRMVGEAGIEPTTPGLEGTGLRYFATYQPLQPFTYEAVSAAFMGHFMNDDLLWRNTEY